MNEQKNWQHLGVRAINQAGPVEVTPGCRLYRHGEDLVLNANPSGTPAGIADESLFPGEGRIIRVLPIPPEPIAEEKPRKGGGDGKSV